MKVKDIVQTVIFVCFVLMIPIFGFTYYLYSQADLELVEVLDKSFGVTAGLFGGAATLTAAYIASLLFNDWRDQVKENRKEYFILKYLEYVDYMHHLIFILTFRSEDFKSQTVLNEKYAKFTELLSPKYLEAGSRLKAIVKDDQLASLIDKEAFDRGELIKEYMENLKSAAERLKDNPHALTDTLNSYSDHQSIAMIYSNTTSKTVVEYCLNKLNDFDH